MTRYYDQLEGDDSASLIYVQYYQATIDSVYERLISAEEAADLLGVTLGEILHELHKRDDKESDGR